MSFKTFAAVVLLVMALGAAWPFGGTSAAVQWALHVGAAVTVVCLLVTLARPSGRATPLPIVVFPLICGLLLGALQLTRFPAKAQQDLSLTTARWRAELMPAESEAASARAGHSLSLYPAATRSRLALLLLGTMCFVAAAYVPGRFNSVLMLLGMAIGGAVLAFFGLAQKLAWDGRLFWRFEIPPGAGPFASFINKNNAAGYLLVCLAAAIGSSVWVSHRYDGGRLSSARRSSARRRVVREGWRDVLLAHLAHLDALSLIAYGSVALILSGVLASMSRGGWIALAGAALITSALAVTSRRRTAILLAVLPAVLVGVCVLCLIGLSEAFETRLNTLFDRTIVSQARIPHWRDGLKAVPDFWMTGSGLGTYRFVYPPYQERHDFSWYYHAENQYLEAAVEAGLPGLLLLGLAILFVGKASWHLVRRAETTEALSLGYAGVFGLSAQVIHAVADFATFIPSVTVIFAVLCGLVCGEAATLGQGKSVRLLILSDSRLGSVACLCALLVLSVFGIAETGCSAMAHAATHEAVLESDSVPTADQVDSVLAQLQTGIGWRPDDAELHVRLAGAYLSQARLAVLGRLAEMVKVRDQQEEIPPEQMNVLWRQTRPAVLHGRVWELLRAGEHRELEQIRTDPAWRSDFEEALVQLRLSRQHCPLLPWTHVRLAEIGYFGDSPDWDQRDVERARWLAPAESDVLFRCGLLDLNAGRIESAAASWRRALALSRSHLHEIMDVGPLPLTDAAAKFIETILPEDPQYLVKLARRYAGREDTALLHTLQKRAVELVAREGTSAWERAFVLGHVARLNGDVPLAAEHFSAAVELQPADSSTRYLLAQVLTELGDDQQAMLHARHLLRNDAENPQYAALAKKIQSARRTRWTSGP